MHSLSTLHVGDRSRPRKTRFQLAGLPWLGGVLTRKVPAKGFCSVSLPPFPGLLGAREIRARMARMDGGQRRGPGLRWRRRAAPSRGPKPLLGVDEIVAAAIELADEEGLAGLSMRRIAERLGFTTM